MANGIDHDDDAVGEDRWRVPEAWTEVVNPVRGFAPYRAFTPDPRAGERYDALIATERETLYSVLALSIPAASSAAAVAALEDPAAATPLGAAGLARVAEPDQRRRDEGADPDTHWAMVVDAWVARYGVVFAAEAALLANTMSRGNHVDQRGRGYDLTPWSAGPYYHPFRSTILLERTREHLVAATDEQYRAAVARLGEIRAVPRPRSTRIAISLLAPTEESWVSAEVAESPTADDYWAHTGYAFLSRAITTAPQLKTFIARLRLDNRTRVTTAGYIEMAARVGPEAAETLASIAFVDHVTSWSREDTRDLADILAYLPTDEAFGLLLANLDRWGVPTAAMAAAHRFPRRAMRMLAADAARSPAVATMLRAHAYRNPDLAAEFGVGLPDLAVVDPAELPDVLRPRRAPAAPPPWLLLPVLPPLLTNDTARAMPESAVTVVCALLAKRNPDPAAIEQLSAILDPMSMAGFAWGLFQAWVFAEYPAGGIWTLRAVGLFGDDEAARLLVPLILQWPRHSAVSRAVAALDVLADIGTPAALGHLRDIGLRTRQRGFRKTARAKLDAVAAQHRISTDELADRAVPDFGLGADGSLVLDYGSRGFVIDLDEHLKPVVHDGRRTDDGSWARGPRRKTLPKPAAQDDRAVAGAAHDRFTLLNAGTKKVAREQIRRLERAMIEGRRWSARAHRELFVDHPLLRQLARRLVWVTVDADGAVRQSFRIAEDLTFADVNDDPFTVDDAAEVGIAHPLHLGGTLAEWTEIFADYAMLQPFSQLDRPTWQPGALAAALRDYHGVATSPGRLLALTHLGWIRETSDGAIDRMVRPLPGGDTAQLWISPSLEWRDLMRHATHTVTAVESTGSALDPVTASELVRELETLRAG